MAEEQALEPACRITSAQRVSAGQGAAWWREAIELLSVDTEHWIMATLLLMVIGAVVGFVGSLVPYVGDLITGLLIPVFSVGLLYMAYRVIHGHAFVYNNVLIGLRHRTKALILAGAAQVQVAVTQPQALVGSGVLRCTCKRGHVSDIGREFGNHRKMSGLANC